MNMNNMVLGQVDAVFDSRGSGPKRIKSRNTAGSQSGWEPQPKLAQGWVGPRQDRWRVSVVPRMQAKTPVSGPTPGFRSRQVITRRPWVVVGLMSVLILTLSPSGGALASSVTDLLNDGLQSHLAGDLRRAVEVYTEVLTKESQNATAFNWRGTAYDDLGELNKALEDLTKAVEIDNKYADAYNNRGEVYRKMGKLNEAFRDYRMASTNDPTFAEAYYNMALVFEAQNKGPQAIEQYKKYLELKPDANDKDAVQKLIAKLESGPATPQPPTRTARPGQPQPPGVGQPPVTAGMTPGEPPTATQAPPKPGDRPGPRPGGPPGPAARPGVLPVQTASAVPAPFNQFMTPEQYRENKEAVDALKPWVDLAQEWAPVAGIALVVLYVLHSLFLFLIARKTGTGPAILAFLPIVDVYLQYRIADKPIWWFLLSLLLPPVYLIMYFVVCLGIARARGKSAIWGVLLFFPLPTRTLAFAYLGLTR